MGHRTMQGREIDMEKLARANELMPAIGNMNVNARGDELGPGGQILRLREEVAAEYYEETRTPRIRNLPKEVQPTEEKTVEAEQMGTKKKITPSEE